MILDFSPENDCSVLKNVYFDQLYSCSLYLDYTRLLSDKSYIMRRLYISACRRVTNVSLSDFHAADLLNKYTHQNTGRFAANALDGII